MTGNDKAKHPRGFEDMDPVAPPAGWVDTTAADKETEAVEDASTAPRRDIRPADPSAWETRVPLSFGLMVDGARVDAIICRRITGGVLTDILMQADGDMEAARRAAYAAIIGLDTEVLHAMEASEFERVMAAAAPFLPPVLRDGLDDALAGAAGATGGQV